MINGNEDVESGWHHEATLHNGSGLLHCASHNGLTHVQIYDGSVNRHDEWELHHRIRETGAGTTDASTFNAYSSAFFFIFPVVVKYCTSQQALPLSTAILSQWLAVSNRREHKAFLKHATYCANRSGRLVSPHHIFSGLHNQ